MNIAFMGTPKVAKDILEEINIKRKVDLVITKEDKIRSRGRKKEYTEVKKYALENNIEVLTPSKIDQEFINYFKEKKIDLVIVVAYGKILNKEFLDIPKYGCINIHFSKLPKYRGASPVETAILNGEKETGISIIKMNEKMDEGDIILDRNFEIDENEGAKEIFEKATNYAKEDILKCIDLIEKDKVVLKKQEGMPSYCEKIDKKETILNLYEGAKKTRNKIRAFNNSLGLKTDILGFNIKIWKSEILQKDSEIYLNLKERLEKKYKKDIIELQKGSIIIDKKGLYICFDNEYLSILYIQPENKSIMNIKDFLNGNYSKINGENIKKL